MIDPSQKTELEYEPWFQTINEFIIEKLKVRAEKDKYGDMEKFFFF